ncbi:MAG TPA: HRDC domain-containing protein [Solirubrobacteraceae bacterium]|nr:HRDC domain-containing protein [Solirubrobacteraceae bacterium]
MSDLAGSADVAALAELARSSGRLGIDTEFMGEGRYQTLLCLVQVAAETGPIDGDVRIEVIDPLDERVDPSPLAELLADPEIEIVMHAGRQDVALLRRVWSTQITNLFDTQLAAGFAGLRAQLGYEALLHELLGVRLKKSASFTRWDARPLSAEQIDYARDDVRHILQATSTLQARLRSRDRLGWAREECVALASATDERDPDAIFARLPRVNSLDPKLRAIARELVVWREETARAQDRPIPSVLSDAALIEVAKRRPTELRQLEQIRGINEPTLRRRGRAILEAVERGRSRSPIAIEGERPSQPDALDAPVIALAEALVRTRALEEELAYELIAARADLQRIVLALRDGSPPPEVRTLQGWRREVVGNELLELLDGRRSLTVGPDRHVAVSSR